MKKLICIILSALLLFGGTCVYAESSAFEKALFKLSALDILPAGTAPDTAVTRAEAATAMVKLMMNDVAWSGEDTGFTDVKSFDEFAGYVHYAKAMGIVAGNGNGTFRPFDAVTINELIKMSVCLLGYGVTAEAEGGYPAGYLSLALRLNLFKNVGSAEDGSITAADFVFLLNNLLQAYPLEATYGADEYKKSEQTLNEIVLERKKTKTVKGLVTAVGKAVLKGRQEAREDEIAIDGVRYQYDGGDNISLLGKNVNAYYVDDEDTEIKKIVEVLEQNSNEELTVNAEDIINMGLTKLEYELSDSKNQTTEKADISQEASFFYNRRLYTPENFDLKSGSVRLVDSDNDGVFETVFVEEYESFIIDRITAVNSTLYFQNDIKYQGKTGFKVDVEDKDKEYSLTNAQGEEIKFEDIKPDMVVSLQTDLGQTVNYVTVSDLTVKGKITSINSAENEIGIDGEAYMLYKIQNESYQVGQEGVFLLNHNEEIVGTSDVSSGEKYGYVIGTSRKGSLNSNYQIKVIGSGDVAREVIEQGGEENITYTYSNGEMQILEFADRINYQGPGDSDYNRVSASDIGESDFYRGMAVYQLNAEGKIKKLRVVTIPESGKLTKYGFNGKLNSFGGVSTLTPFLVSNSTQIICIPLPVEGVSIDDNDYMVDVTIADKSELLIVPVDIDEKTQIAEAAVIIERMDYDIPKPFDSLDKVAIVGQVRESLNENGDTIYKLEVLSGDVLEKPYIMQDAVMADTVAKLKCGDLIYYNTKQNGEINNIQYVASMSTLGKDYFIDSVTGGKKMLFAQAQSIELNRLDARYNEMVDVLSLYANGETKRYSAILREDGPTVYSYSRSSGKIRSASTDEILTIEEVGEDASDLFITEQSNNTPEVIVIVEK